MMGEGVRFRLVVMGDSYVGKSSIVKRFLTGNFNINYVATVEDLYSRDFDIGGTELKVDILDTAGDAQFPAMRRLSIASAHAFLLVYSVTDPLSFVTVKQRFEEIKEQRPDYQEIPIVIAGNKVDVVREIEPEDIQDWVTEHLPKERTCVLECSAAENSNIREIFRNFLKLSKINVKQENKDDSNLSTMSSNFLSTEKIGSQKPGVLKRNLSAYGRLKSNQGKSPAVTRKEIFEALEEVNGHKKLGKQGSSGPPSNTDSPAVSPRDIKFLGFSFTVGNNANKSVESTGSPCNGKVMSPVVEKLKTPVRSRSLIRRSSRKAKQQMGKVQNPDDCVVS